MASTSEHLAQAAHNDEVLGFFRQQNKHVAFGDWYVTISFYTAVHYIEAALYAIKLKVNDVPMVHSADHGHRLCLLKSGFRRLHDDYVTLYQMCQIAKYNKHRPNDYNWSKAVSLLENIKAECTVIREKSN